MHHELRVQLHKGTLGGHADDLESILDVRDCQRTVQVDLLCFSFIIIHCFDQAVFVVLAKSFLDVILRRSFQMLFQEALQAAQ